MKMPFQQNKSSSHLWYSVNLLNGIVFLTFMCYPSTWRVLVWVPWNFTWGKSILARCRMSSPSVRQPRWKQSGEGQEQVRGRHNTKGQHLKNMSKGREGVHEKESHDEHHTSLSGPVVALVVKVRQKSRAHTNTPTHLHTHTPTHPQPSR